MILLFFLMVAGHAFGTAAAVLSPQGRVVRRGAATGAVVGGGRDSPSRALGAVWVRAIQSGSVHAYLTYLVLALVGLLTLLLVWGA